MIASMYFTVLGKGMYAAADYTKGKDLTHVIDEMAHYQQLGTVNLCFYFCITQLSLHCIKENH